MLLAAGGDRTFGDSCQPTPVDQGNSEWVDTPPRAICRPLLYKKKKPGNFSLHPLRIPCPLPHCSSAPPDRPKLKTEVSPGEANVTEGDSVTMTCQVISSHPECQTISWHKDGQLLRQQEPQQREKTLTLTLSKVTRLMGGKYRCEASNDVGLAVSEVDLQVHCEPPGRCERAGRESAGWSRGP